MRSRPVRSAGLCAALSFWAWRGRVSERALRIIPGDDSEAGEPVEETGVLVPFRQVAVPQFVKPLTVKVWGPEPMR